MPIIDLQRRLRQAGRIRIGDRGGRNGAPRKLAKFRLTSNDRQMLETAANLYGGTVEPWTENVGEEWQVLTDRDHLDVVVPPTEMAFSQWYEMWSGGGCLRRCDGDREMIADKPCQCDPTDRECDAHTRLSVMLRDLPGVGTWRIDSQGYNAAAELLGTVELIQRAAAQGQMLPARLLLDKRTSKKEGKTFKFVVPVLDLDMKVLPNDLGAGGTVAALGTGAPAFTRVPPSLEPGPTVRDQIEPPEPKAPRANAAAPVKGSGKSRRRTVPASGDAAPDGGAAEGGGGSDPSLSDPAPPSAADPAPEQPTLDGASPAVAEQPAVGEGVGHSDEDKARASAVARMCSDKGLTSDDQRHSFIEAFTEGASTSSYSITADDMPTFRSTLVKFTRGEVTLVDTADGWRFETS